MLFGSFQKKMTSFDKTVEALEKMANIPCHNEDNKIIFIVKGSSIESQVQASSSFEAAVKMGYLLYDLNLLKSLTVVEVEVTDVNTEAKYFYDVSEGSSQIAVELNRVLLKNFPDGIQNVNPATLDVESSTSTTNMDGEGVEGADDLVTRALRQFFGFESFRPLQKETISSTMNGRSVLTITGTGGGKTLMYMLPAVLSTKPTLVLCPIKSLIDDLLHRCSDLDINACKFTGDVSQHDKEEQMNVLPAYKIIFCTPEVLEDGTALRKKMEELEIERIVFDEAHTISSWGSTFRPVYKAVCGELAKFQCPKLLLSATIPLKMENSLRELFGDFDVYRNSIFRDNLTLEVVERGSKVYDDLASFIRERPGQCGIVYCVLPHDVAKIHAELLKRDINVVKYHGQLSEDVKASSQSKWMSGEVKVIVANSSFGMGIDKSDVRFILHARLPTSVDEYYQQCGRAGRDGSPATCRIYYSYSDKSMLYKLFDKQDQEFASQCTQLNDLIDILENPVKCRHGEIMAYFGDVHESFACQTGCDNCKDRGQYQITDGTSDGLKVVQAIVELTGKNISCNDLKLFLAGSRQKSIIASGLDAYTNFGAFSKSGLPTTLLDKFLHLLINSNILSENIQKKGKGFAIYITLGAKAHDLLGLNTSVIKYDKVK